MSVSASGKLAPASTADLAAGAQIPLVRLDGADQALLDELLRTVAGVATRGAFTLGDEVEAFEREFAAWCGTADAVGLSSGTEALVLALRALKIGPGDEVIVPANSFIATAEAVTLVGAAPRLVDVDPVTGLVTAPIVERAVGPTTRAVIPVHLYGATVDMEPLLRLAQAAGLEVIEDACQAHGAQIGARRAGSLGRLGCFSFYPTKNLGAWGDGGAVVTSDADLAERIRLLRSHGESPAERHRHRMPGTTARLDGLQAAILRVKLRRLDEWNDARRRNAAELCRSAEGASLELPVVPPTGDHVFHLFVIQCDRREELRAHLSARAIASAVHYPVPIHLTEAYADLEPELSLPVAERRASRICSIPLYPGMSSDEIDRIADALVSFRPSRTRPKFIRSNLGA
jgi:dTDP-3-amino-3,4,6-trideoxy-alpha-D-glucose transaminase